MTYALALPLQQAVFQHLSADPGVTALAAGRVFDAPPQLSGDAEAEAAYAVIGDESVQDWSSADTAGAAHTLGISVFATERSFIEAKRLAGAVSDALIGVHPAMSRGRIVTMRFLSARTRREQQGRVRRIDLRFRALIEDDA
ncbi:MAG: DUF3168 domain-containing protein [Pseudomonadota bacterium]